MQFRFVSGGDVRHPQRRDASLPLWAASLVRIMGLRDAAADLCPGGRTTRPQACCERNPGTPDVRRLAIQHLEEGLGASQQPAKRCTCAVLACQKRGHGRRHASSPARVLSEAPRRDGCFNQDGYGRAPCSAGLPCGPALIPAAAKRFARRWRASWISGGGLPEA